MSNQVPIVKYLALGDDPHLVANECTSCSARYFDDRDACAKCFGTSFAPAAISTTGTLRTYTIVQFSAPGIPVPFVAGVIDCDGTSVKANVINIEAIPENVSFGMPLRLATFSLGVDDDGDELFGFGFEPAGNAAGNGASA